MERFEFETSAQFTADPETRTITGIVVPYGEVARRGGRQFRFLPGSVRFSETSRVKLLRDHDPRLPLGKAVEFTETDAGLIGKFSVAPGAAGDEALALAAHGTLDGFSVGVDDMKFRRDGGVHVVHASVGKEVSLTAMPAFDSSRLTSVALSADEGDGMTTVEQTPAAQPGQEQAAETFTAADVKKMVAEQLAEFAAQRSERVPAHGGRPGRSVAFVSEPVAYRFDRGGNFAPETEHRFGADLLEMAQFGDVYGDRTEAGKRVMGLLAETFAVTSSNVSDLNPTIQRPDMYVDQREYRTPLWNFVNKGAPPNGINPFRFPKFNSASGLVGDHTEGVEPDSGAFTATGQTVTPSGLSGKASITRETWDMGGNPATDTLIYNQMKRGYREGLETATATFLNTLTAAADINLGAGVIDDALAAAWDAALADLQFIRGYDFEAFALEKNLYKAFVAARDDGGQVLYPIINPSNRNGQAASRFRTLDLGGVTGVPSWALTATAGSPNNSWLFDPSTVHGWATAPTKLVFPGTDASGDYAPVAMVDIAIWGYKAFANSDIGGVRQVIYDTTA